MMSGSQQRFEDAPGVGINYEIHGSGAKPAVFLHGFGASLESWRDIQPYLEPFLRLYLVDLKGFGLSAKPRDLHYSLDDQADIIGSFLDRLELGSVCLSGHSYGGAIALVTCLKTPARIDSLILIDSPAASQRLPFFISPLTNPLLRPLLYVTPAHQRTRYVLKRIMYDPARVTPERVDRYARFLTQPGSRRALMAVAMQILPKDPNQIASRLGSIGIPALILWGDHDDVIPRWQADLLKAQIPNSKLVIIPRCGHMPPEERPEETAREILSFLGVA